MDFIKEGRYQGIIFNNVYISNKDNKKYKFFKIIFKNNKEVINIQEFRNIPKVSRANYWHSVLQYDINDPEEILKLHNFYKKERLRIF